MRPAVLFLPALFLLSTAACTSSTTGTGDGRPTDGTTPNNPSNGDQPNITQSGGTGTSGGSEGANGEENSSGGYDALFDAPPDPTTTENTLSGLWAGSTYYADVRIQISASSVVIALKCGTDPAIGLDIGAQVTANTIKLLATKTIGQAGTPCSMKVSPRVIPRCGTSDPGGCFDLEGTTLKFSTELFESVSPPRGEFTKLSD
jgi:hypothetical protein